MTKNVNQVNVAIFGQEYPIACPPGEEDGLRKSAIRVDEEMRRIRNASKVMSTDRIAVIVALNLAYEILRTEQQTPNSDAGSAEQQRAGTAPSAGEQQRINKMQHDIDAALQLYGRAE